MSIKPVKYFNASMAGAPALSGTVGALLAILDACLVNGFNLQTLTSLEVSGGVMTGTKTAHGYKVNQVLLTDGANESALNTEWTITSVSANTFSADATGISNTTGTGTITCKAAPAGWSKLFSGTNKGVYKSVAVGTTGCPLRVDDTGTTVARVVGYESMTDVDTGVGPFPTAVQVSGGGYWFKSNVADATSRDWALIASDTFFVFVRKSLSGNSKITGFGDFTSEKAGDAARCVLTTDTANQPGTSSYYQDQLSATAGASLSAGAAYLPRSYTQIGTAISAVCVSAAAAYSTMTSGLTSASLAYPAPTNNGLLLNTVQLREQTTGPLRCLALPGVFHTPQQAPLVDYDIVTGVDGYSGRNFVALQITNNAAVGRVFVDITGPWA